MSTRKSHTSLPPVRTEESARKPASAPQASVEPSPLLLRLLEVQGEIATLADKGELEEVMRLITTRAQELSGAAGAALGFIEEGELHCRAATGSVSRALGERMGLATMTGQSAATGQAMRCDDTELDARVDRATARRMGAPIPAEVQPQLFDAFRSESLGLFITREIARAHGGDVEVRSSAAEGTTFRVRLPRGPALVR